MKAAMRALKAVGGILLVFLVLLIVARAVWLFAVEIQFSLHGRQATADVYSSAGRKTWRRLDVAYKVEGQPVFATMETVSYRAPVRGDQVPILYLPDSPSIVTPDSLWRRYLPPSLFLVAGAFLFVVVVWPRVRVLLRARRMGRARRAGAAPP